MKRARKLSKTQYPYHLLNCKIIQLLVPSKVSIKQRIHTLNQCVFQTRNKFFTPSKGMFILPHFSFRIISYFMGYDHKSPY